MKKTLTLVAVASTFLFSLTALAAFAQVSSTGVEQGFGTLASIINAFNKTIVKALGTLFLSCGVVAFFFGLMKFIWGLREGETKAITNGKQFMIGSLTALFVMFSVYGIIKFFQSMVPGLDNNSISIPEIRYEGQVGGGQGGGIPAGGAQGGTLCPNGVGRYNNPSDYRIMCDNSGGSAGGAQGGALRANGEQCTLSSQCSSGNCQSGPYGSQCAPGSGSGNPKENTCPIGLSPDGSGGCTSFSGND